VGIGFFPAPSQVFCDSKQSFPKTAINGRISGSVGLAFFEEILEAEIQWIHPQLLGNYVRVGLVGPRDLNGAEATKGAGRDCIRINCVRKNLKVRDAVRTNGSVGSLLSETRSCIGIGPGVEINLTVSGNQLSLASHAGLESDSSGMSRYGSEAFFSRLHQLDWPASFPRQSHCNRLGLDRELPAKRAADKRDNDTDHAPRHAKNARKVFPKRKRILRGCPNGYPLSFDIGDCDVGLD